MIVIVQWDNIEPRLILNIDGVKVLNSKEKDIFDKLVCDYSIRLAKYINSSFRLRDSIQDHVQEIVLCSYTILPRYNYQKSTFKTYLTNRYKWQVMDSLSTRKKRSIQGLEEMCLSDTNIIDIGENGEVIRRKDV